MRLCAVGSQQRQFFGEFLQHTLKTMPGLLDRMAASVLRTLNKNQ